MPHIIQETSEFATNYVHPTSRYNSSGVVIYSEQRYRTFELYKRRIRNNSGGEQRMEITYAYEYRPDLLSYELYGTPDLWWSILEFNGIKDIMDFKQGINIAIPGSVLL